MPVDRRRKRTLFDDGGVHAFECLAERPQEPVRQPSEEQAPDKIHVPGRGFICRLQQALADVEKQEQAAAESMRPQTVAEADELQRKLQGALEELKAHRADLEKKEKSKQ